MNETGNGNEKLEQIVGMFEYDLRLKYSLKAREPRNLSNLATNWRSKFLFTPVH